MHGGKVLEDVTDAMATWLPRSAMLVDVGQPLDLQGITGLLSHVVDAKDEKN